MSAPQVLLVLLSLYLEFTEPQGLLVCTPGNCSNISSVLQNLSDNCQLELVEQEYPIDTSVKVENISNLTILGKVLNVTLNCHLGSGGLRFINITTLTIKNIAFKSCGVYYPAIYDQMVISVPSYSILIAFCSNVILDKISVTNTSVSVVGLVLINVHNSSILISNFTDNAGGGLLLKSVDSTNNTMENMQVNISSCRFINNKNNNPGGGLAVMLVQRRFNVQVHITDSMFESNTATNGGGMYVAMFSDVAPSFVHLVGCMFQSNIATKSGGGMFLSAGLESDPLCCSSIIANFTMTVSSSLFNGNVAEDGGAIRILSRQLFTCFGLYSVDISNNSALKASAVSLTRNMNFGLSNTHVILIFEGCNIQGNISPHFPSASAAALIVKGAVLILRFHNSITDTLGTGIKINDGKIHINGTVLISGNQGINGGALQLLDDSTIYLYNNSVLDIANNKALFYGGGIFVDDCGSSDCCFINPAGPQVFHDCQFGNNFKTKINFYGNQALRGTSIYGPTLNCSWIFDPIEEFYFSCSGKHFMIFNDANNIISTPGNLRLYPSKNIFVKPGSVFSIPVQSYDEYSQSIEDVLIYQIINSNSSIVSSQAEVINSMSPLEVKAVGAQNETVDVEIVSSSSLSKLKVRVNLISCGIGYWYNESTQTCNCHVNFSRFYIPCNTSDITSPEGIWLGRNEANDELVWGFCLRQYCKNGASHIIDGNFDFQCEFNRSGLLCSECPDDFSITLSSIRECRKCSNTSILLIIGVLLLGVVIVVAIAFCRVDISNGYVLSIIFQSNMLSAYGTQLVPKDWQIVFIGVDIISLKLNLYACFYDGMTDLGAIMVQFAFIFYLLILVGVTCAIVSRITLPASHANIPTKAAPTFILMCQVALMELCTSGLSYVSVQSLDSGLIEHRWQASPDLAYIKSLHALPFSMSIATVVILLLPMILVLIYPPCPYRSALLGKLKPVYDVLWAPFRAKRRWWLIFRILVSWAVFLCATIPSHSDDSIFALCLILVILIFLQVQLKPYAKKWINCLDESFLFVILLMAIGRLYFSPIHNYLVTYFMGLVSCFYAIIILVALIHFYTMLPILFNDITSIFQCLRVYVGKCCIRRRHDDLVETDLVLEVPTTEVSVAGLRAGPDLNDDVIVDTSGGPLANVATMGPVGAVSDPVAAKTLDNPPRSAEDESSVDRSTNEEQFHTCKSNGNST